MERGQAFLKARAQLKQLDYMEASHERYMEARIGGSA